VKYENLKFYK